MRLKYLIFCVILMVFVVRCVNNDVIPPEGCIGISELETEHDYYLPFALENETGGIRYAILNNDTIGLPDGGYVKFSENGFYELVLIYEDLQQENDTFLFTTKTEERENSEWGIKAWIPKPFEPVALDQEDIEMFYPRHYADLIKVPFIFYIRESGVIKPVYCRGKQPSSGRTFNIKQGVGSVNIAASSIPGNINFTVGGKQKSANLTLISTTPIELKGTISTPTVIPANSLVRISDHLEITSSGSLTLHEGAVILVNEAVDIDLSGPVTFSGTSENPVFVTCSRSEKYWGGFITKGSGGSIEAHYTIFCQSGYHDSDDYAWGHAGRQALFYTENSTLSLDHCFMLDHIGQIFYPKYSTLTLDEILVQRAKTGGQINYSELSLRNSVLTDFPDDSYIFEDNDNDALYLIATDAAIDNTAFMFAKDDGLDSGGDEGGEVTVTNCRFEACFHEGAALSSQNEVAKTHIFTGCVFTNCGQGLELGFSSPNHTVTADNCMFLNNGTGIRYGDNYAWADVNGKMHIKNSFSLHNDKDIWNMVRMIWSPKLEKMSFENTVISKFCPQYPGLETGN